MGLVLETYKFEKDSRALVRIQPKILLMMLIMNCTWLMMIMMLLMMTSIVNAMQKARNNPLYMFLARDVDIDNYFESTRIISWEFYYKENGKYFRRHEITRMITGFLKTYKMLDTKELAVEEDRKKFGKNWSALITDINNEASIFAEFLQVAHSAIFDYEVRSRHFVTKYLDSMRAVQDAEENNQHVPEETVLYFPEIDLGLPVIQTMWLRILGMLPLLEDIDYKLLKELTAILAKFYYQVNTYYNLYQAYYMIFFRIHRVRTLLKVWRMNSRDFKLEEDKKNPNVTIERDPAESLRLKKKYALSLIDKVEGTYNLCLKFMDKISVEFLQMEKRIDNPEAMFKFRKLVREHYACMSESNRRIDNDKGLFFEECKAFSYDRSGPDPVDICNVF